MSIENEQRYFDALKRITLYYSVDQLRQCCQREYGLEFEEGLEMAYENVIQEAHNALRGRRRPRLPVARDRHTTPSVPATASRDANAAEKESEAK